MRDSTEDGVEEGALSIRKRCLMEVEREAGVDDVRGGGGRGPEGGGYRGPAGILEDDGIGWKFTAGDLLSLLEFLRCERIPFSSGQGGRPTEGGGFGEVNDNLRAR